MKYAFPKGSTSVIVPVFIQDSSSTTGAGLGGLDQTSSIVGGYVRPDGTGVALAVDENVTTEGTYQAPTTAGQIRIGTPANMRTGTYELHLHNDLLAAGASAVFITLGGASNMADLILEIQLTTINLNDGVRGGMTALPNAAADGAGGLPVSDVGGLDLDAKLANTDEVTAARMGALTDWINGGRLDLLLDAIPTTAMRGTDSAALASVCTEARLAELDAANLPTDVDAILADTNQVQVRTGYIDGRVWIDTVGGAAGTTVGTHGTFDNPVNTIADALTIAASLGTSSFHVLPGSSFTLAASVANKRFTGNRYVVALGGQNVSGAVFENAQITGNDSGSNALATAYINCLMNDNTLGVHQQIECGLGGDITLAQAGMVDWVRCYSRVAGTSTPSVDLGAAIGNTNFNMRAYSGGIEVKNIGQAGTDNISLEGHGQLVLNANCAGGTIAIRGHFTVTDNVVGGFVVGGGVLSQDARFTVTRVRDAVTGGAYALDTDANGRVRIVDGTAVGELDTASGRVDIGSIQGNTDAATRLALSADQIIPATVDTVVNTHTPTTTEFQADDITEATADHFNGRIVIFTSGVLAGQATDITDYVAVGGIGQFTVTAMTEAPANDDTFVIV